MEKLSKLYSGKVKTLYQTTEPDSLIVSNSDIATAFNAQKKDCFAGKGKLNNYINAFLMQYLESKQIKTHFTGILSETDSLVKHLKMIPVECVVRNIAAGSLCRRLGLKSGEALKQPIFEFYFKDDALGDPFVNTEHLELLEVATEGELAKLRLLSLNINTHLRELFHRSALQLVDFKLEFGRFQGEVFLGDEITPDSCRIWRMDDGEILDKDRFRKDLGKLVWGYEEIANRLGIEIPISEGIH